MDFSIAPRVFDQKNVFGGYLHRKARHFIGTLKGLIPSVITGFDIKIYGLKIALSRLKTCLE